jgi:hypothetical protein
MFLSVKKIIPDFFIQDFLSPSAPATGNLCREGSWLQGLALA